MKNVWEHIGWTAVSVGFVSQEHGRWEDRRQRENGCEMIGYVMQELIKVEQNFKR